MTKSCALMQGRLGCETSLLPQLLPSPPALHLSTSVSPGIGKQAQLPNQYVSTEQAQAAGVTQTRCPTLLKQPQGRQLLAWKVWQAQGLHGIECSPC